MISINVKNKELSVDVFTLDSMTAPTKNSLKPNELKLSNIFNWYGGDFTKKGTLIDYLNQYATIKISSKASTSYMDYDWSLNKQ